MYKVVFTPKAEKQLEKLPKDIQPRVINSLKRIRVRPQAHLIKLVGDPAYKLRVGNYRVLIDIQNNKLILLVIKIGHRKKVYKR